MISERTMATGVAVFCGFMCAWGWIYAGVPHRLAGILFCTACHAYFLWAVAFAWRARP